MAGHVHRIRAIILYDKITSERYEGDQQESEEAFYIQNRCLTVLQNSLITANKLHYKGVIF